MHQSLARGANFDIRLEANDVVVCTVVNSDTIDAAEGARCAAEMHAFVRTQVARPGAPYRGLVLDVRRASPVFGPKTREAMGHLLAALERAGRRTAVLVGAAAMQRLQFGSLCREEAPTAARVFAEEAEAHRWAAGA